MTGAVALPRWSDGLIALEPPVMEQLEFLLQLRNHPDVLLHTDREPMAAEDSAAWLQRIVDSNADGTGATWLLREQLSGRPVGTAGIWRIDRDHNFGEVGYSLLPTFWGRGYARRAMQAVIDHGFGRMGLHRIEANINPANERSRALLHRLGFRLEAQLRENYRFRDRYIDSHIYGMLASEREAACPLSGSSP